MRSTIVNPKIESLTNAEAKRLANPKIESLTLAEGERLALLLEELGEAQQMIGKILRFGYENFNPFDPRATPNRKLLERELGDIEHAVRLMEKKGDVSSRAIFDAAIEKEEKIGRFLFFQGDDS